MLEQLAADSALVTALAKLDDETPIGVICMYAGQKRQIELAWSRRPFDPKFKRLVRIDTVDSYQGKENAIVILSLVRSNPKGYRDTWEFQTAATWLFRVLKNDSSLLEMRKWGVGLVRSHPCAGSLST